MGDLVVAFSSSWSRRRGKYCRLPDLCLQRDHQEVPQLCQETQEASKSSKSLATKRATTAQEQCLLTLLTKTLAQIQFWIIIVNKTQEIHWQILGSQVTQLCICNQEIVKNLQNKKIWKIGLVLRWWRLHLRNLHQIRDQILIVELHQILLLWWETRQKISCSSALTTTEQLLRIWGHPALKMWTFL